MPKKQNNHIAEVCCTATDCTQQQQLVHNRDLDVLLVRLGLNNELVKTQKTKKEQAENKSPNEQLCCNVCNVLDASFQNTIKTKLLALIISPKTLHTIIQTFHLNS